jgi:hypothetical protein
VGQCFENKIGGTTSSQNSQRNNRGYEEDNMAYTTNHLQGVEQSSEPQIPDHRNNDETPHDQGGMPSLRLIVLVVEDNKSLNYVGEISWTGSRTGDPGENGDPSFRKSAPSHNVNPDRARTLKQTPEPWFEGSKSSRPSILSADHRVPWERLFSDISQMINTHIEAISASDIAINVEPIPANRLP